MSLHERIFLTSSTWQCPAGVRRVELEGCGGGGGGGAGDQQANATNLWSAGGSGGGGSILCKVTITVVPNTVYTVTIGSGGSGGSAPNSDDAVAGGPTRLELSGSYKCIFAGAGRGRLGGSTTGSQLYYYRRGGLPVGQTSEENIYSYIWLINTGDITNYLVRPISEFQHGGFSVGTNDTSMAQSGYGGSAPITIGQNDGTAGNPGTQGSDGGLYRGGGSGGGGGAGAYQASGEGNGGNGGNGNNGGVGASGTAGSSCSANTGGGGGGGGACGYGSGGRGNGAIGGAGGSGKLIIRWNT